MMLVAQEKYHVSHLCNLKISTTTLKKEKKQVKLILIKYVI